MTSERNLRILVPSNSAWSESNSFGSTFSSIFGTMPNVSIVSIYGTEGETDWHRVSAAFQITELSLISNLLDSTVPSGKRVNPLEVADDKQPEEITSTLSRILEWSREHRFSAYRLALMGRELIWQFSRWRSPQLTDFVASEHPDLIFQSAFNSFHQLRLAEALSEQTDIPSVGYIADDNYSLRQFSLSPLYWIARFGKRHLIRKAARRFSWLYVISDAQKTEYEKTLGIECRVLTKLANFSGESMPEQRQINDEDYQIVFTYAGNVGNGRWKSLSHIGRALKLSRARGVHARLDVYTSTPLNGRMRRAFARWDTIRLHDAVPPKKLRGIYERSDVLLLVEPTDLAGRLSVRLSFSTKVVEYFHAGRPILAFGPEGIASLSYLKEHGAALTATPKDDLASLIYHLASDRRYREELANNGWRLGLERHDQQTVSAQMRNDLLRLLKES